MNSYDYSNAWYEGYIDLATLPLGVYRFEINTKSGDTSGNARFSNSLVNAPRLDIKTIDEKTYTLSFNNKSKMRYELSVDNGIFIENRSVVIPSQIPSVGIISILNKIDGSELFRIKGFAFMNDVSMGVDDNVVHELWFVSEAGEKYTYPLTSITDANISIDGNDYSYAWFESTEISLSELPIGKYRMYIYTSTNLFNDIVKIYDSSNTGIREFNSNNKNFKFSPIPQLRNIYNLEVTE